MKPPKYEPLKMSNRYHADDYGRKMMRYRKWLEKKQRAVTSNETNK
jgi:hypothetical protein